MWYHGTSLELALKIAADGTLRSPFSQELAKLSRKGASEKEFHELTLSADDHDHLLWFTGDLSDAYWNFVVPKKGGVVLEFNLPGSPGSRTDNVSLTDLSAVHVAPENVEHFTKLREAYRSYTQNLLLYRGSDTHETIGCLMKLGLKHPDVWACYGANTEQLLALRDTGLLHPTAQDPGGALEIFIGKERFGAAHMRIRGAKKPQWLQSLVDALRNPPRRGFILTFSGQAKELQPKEIEGKLYLPCKLGLSIDYLTGISPCGPHYPGMLDALNYGNWGSEVYWEYRNEIPKRFNS